MLLLVYLNISRATQLNRMEDTLRCYEYNQGTWRAIESPLKHVDDLDPYGFDSSIWVSVTLHGLALYVHGRDPDSLPAQRAKNEFPYDFCLWLDIGSPSIRYIIWIPDLPSLLLFLNQFQVGVATDTKDLIETLNRMMNGYVTPPTIPIKQEE